MGFGCGSRARVAARDFKVSLDYTGYVLGMLRFVSFNSFQCIRRLLFDRLFMKESRSADGAS